jgi:hypothetical protein
MSVRELAARTPAAPVLKGKTVDELRAELQRIFGDLSPSVALMADWIEHRYLRVTASYDVVDETVILADAAGGAVTITLPTSDNDAINRAVHVKKLNTTAGAAVTVAARGTDLIDGAASYALTTQYESRHFVSDGIGGWHILSLHNPAAGGGGPAPADATYVTLSLNASLTQERVLTAGTGITLTDAGANSTATVAINPAFFAGFANPSAQVALTAINGVAVTAMRSDAAPRLNITISPTGAESWSGTHNWAPSANTTPVTITKTAGLSSANIALITNTAATEHFIRVANSGATGFGFLASAADPIAIVHAVADGALTVSNAMLFDAYGASINCALLQRRALGSRSAPRRVSGTNFTLGGIFTFGATAVDDITNSTFPASTVGSIEFFSREAFTTTAQGTACQIHTTPTLSTTRIPRFTIDENGNVGIGLNTAGAAYGTLASAKLHVISAVNAQLRIGADVAGTIFAEIRQQPTTGIVELDVTGGTTPAWVFEDNVGIGTGLATAPTNRLQVLSTTTPQFRISNDGTHYVTEEVAGDGATQVRPQTDDTASLIQYMVRPSSALTSTTVDGRATFAVKRSAGANPTAFICYANGTTEFGGSGGFAADGVIVVRSASSKSSGMNFAPASATSTGGTYGGVSLAVTGAYFATTPGATPAASNYIGGVFETTLPVLAANVTGLYGAIFRPISTSVSNGARTVTDTFGYLVTRMPGSAGFGNFTTVYGGKIDQAFLNAPDSCTNDYRLYIGVPKFGSTINNGIFIECDATTGQRAIAIRSQNEFIHSGAAGNLTMGAGTGFVISIGGTDQASIQAGLWQVSVDPFNFQLPTGTGTKWGTATTEKQAWWNATPVVQPANTAAIDTLLTTVGFRASGGVANFDTDIKAAVVGKGLYVKEGANATMGVATLVAGTVVVNTTKVTANSRIFLTVQALGTVAVATPVAVTARTAATSFTITSSAITDTSVVAWLLMEPA